MNKRIMSMLLSAVILVSFFAVGASATEETAETQEAEQTVETVEATEPAEVPEEEKKLTSSDEMIRILKLEEGFSKKPYWDYAQWTVGYGTKCPDDKLEYYKQNGIPEEDAEQLLREFLQMFESEVHNYMKKTNTQLNQNQFDALVLFSYNCGSSWSYDKTGGLYNAVRKGATGNVLIDAFTRWCNAGGQIQTYLLRRRLSEANMYLNGVYSQTPPANYGYVMYDACGGTSKPNIQGFDTELTASIIPTPTYSGYTFDGWYTARTGGTKVTVLTANVKNSRLYAHWVNGEGNDPSQDTSQGGTQVTVTGEEVNVRQGPGTGYKIVGVAVKGDQMVITETAQGSGYTWGKFMGGWICLEYTDYFGDSKPEEPEKPAEPEEPEEPETPTEPDKTEGEMGTVKVSDGLNVRSGPSTGYEVVASLSNGTRVEILEQKLVGAQRWGKIKEGWVSMSYIVLDSDKKEDDSTTAEPEPPKAEEQTKPTTGWTGKINAKDHLRIRKEPSTSSEIVGYLAPGEKVTVTEEKTSGSMTWGKISKGWISLDYVTRDSGSTETTTPKITGTVKVDDSLRVRSGPGTSYAISGYLTNGTKVEITEQKTVGGMTWGKTAKGWISMDYVVVDKLMGTVKVADSLRIRSGAGSNYDTVGYLTNGTKVEILEQKTVNGTTWGKISNGWISMSYVNLDNQSGQSQKVVKTVTADSLRVRSTPGTSGTIVGYLTNGAKVEILEQKTVNGTTWGKISNGWISMDYLK